MELSLINGKRVELKKTALTNWLFLSGNVKVDLPPGEVSSMLEKSLKRSGPASMKRARLDANATEPSLDFSVCFRLPAAGSSYIKVSNNMKEDNCLSRLERACGGFDNLRFEMKLKLSSERDDVKADIEGNEIQARNFLGTTPPSVGIIVWHKSMTEALIDTWSSMSNIKAELTVRVKLRDAAFLALEMDDLDDPFSACKAMRANIASTDAVIICEGGRAKVRCHKGFLSAHSSVFKAMFESRMEEGTSGELKLLDMTESGVEALLDYLYCWEIKESCKSCSIALELFVAADKYDITRLQGSIQRLLLLKEADWFTVSVVVQLLDFSKKRIALLEGDEEEDSAIKKVYKSIEVKCITDLKSKSAAELQECPEFQQLFQHPKVAMEFFTYFMLFGQ